MRLNLFNRLFETFMKKKLLKHCFLLKTLTYRHQPQCVARSQL